MRIYLRNGSDRPVTSMSHKMKPLCKRTPTTAKRTTQRCHTVLNMYVRSQSARMRAVPRTDVPGRHLTRGLARTPPPQRRSIADE